MWEQELYQAEFKTRLATGVTAKTVTKSQAPPEAAAKHLATDTNYAAKYQVQVKKVETKEASVYLPIGSPLAAEVTARQSSSTSPIHPVSGSRMERTGNISSMKPMIRTNDPQKHQPAVSTSLCREENVEALLFILQDEDEEE